MKNKNLTLLSIIVVALIGFVVVSNSNQDFPRAQTPTLPPLCNSFTGNPCSSNEICTRYPVQGTAPEPNDTRLFRCVNILDAFPPSTNSGLTDLSNNQQQSQQNQNTTSGDTSCDVIESLRNNAYVINYLNEMCRQQAQTYAYTLFSMAPTVNPFGYVPVIPPAIPTNVTIGDIQEEGLGIRASCSAIYSVNGGERRSVTLPDVGLTEHWINAMCLLGKSEVTPFVSPSLIRATPSFEYDSFGQPTIPFNTGSPTPPELEELQYLLGQPAVTPDPRFPIEEIIRVIQFGLSALDEAVRVVTSESGDEESESESGDSSESDGETDQRNDNTQNITSLNRSSLPSNFVALSTSGFVSPCFSHGGFENRDGSQRGCEPIKCADGQEFPTCLFNGLPVLSCPNNTNAGIGYCSCEDLKCYPINY